MTLAIVIPYYKYTFFEATLESLANQTDKRFNVYIGDDASQQNPQPLLEKFRNSFSFTYKRFDENLGGISLVKQWERCLELSKDEAWVMILGDDDTMGENVVAEFYAQLGEINSWSSHVVRFATVVINEQGQAISRKHEHPKIETAAEFLLRKFKGGTRSSLSEYVFRRQKLDAIGFKAFPLAWSVDTLAVVEFSEGNPIFTINNAAVQFRLSSQNITNQGDSIQKNEAWYQFYYYLIATYGDQYPKALLCQLFDRLEKTQINHKKTPLRWLKLFKLYVYFFQYSRFLTLFVKVKNSYK